jgi:hypothetical protein
MKNLGGNKHMKKLIVFIASGFLFLATIPPVFAKGPQGQAPQGQGTTPLGFSTLLCMADALLDGAELPGDPIVLFGGQVMVDDLSPVSTSGGFSTIMVRITHGKTHSDHTITFTDTDLSGTLNCGDTIVSVS